MISLNIRKINRPQFFKNLYIVSIITIALALINLLLSFVIAFVKMTDEKTTIIVKIYLFAFNSTTFGFILIISIITYYWYTFSVIIDQK